MPTYQRDDISIQNGDHSAKDGHIFKPVDHYNSNASISSVSVSSANTYSSQGSINSSNGGNSRFNSSNLNYIAQSHSRSTSVGSIPIAFIRPTSPEMQNNRPSLEHSIKSGSLTEELTNYQHYQRQLQQQSQQDQTHQIELQYPTPEIGVYQHCLKWLQQSCQPVHMKDLSQLSNVRVPITAANAKHPSQIGGTQDVQVAMWNHTQVQVMPIDRWGNPQEVLAE
ncbi:hypothetical protein BGX21_003092, partial [Mortierella sp. AD011]